MGWQEEAGEVAVTTAAVDGTAAAATASGIHSYRVAMAAVTVGLRKIHVKCLTLLN